MLDLSDWIWLAVVVLWVVARAVSRLFRNLAKRDGAAAPQPSETPAGPGSPSAAEERMGDVAPKPIEPR